MPVERFGFVQFALLLLIVPLQYLITTYYSASDVEKGQELRQLMSKLTQLRDSYISLESWQNWLNELVMRWHSHIAVVHGRYYPERQSSSAETSSESQPESPAVEVFNYRNLHGYFADGLEPRSPRDPDVKLRVGQVVRHRIHGYRAVIIGWDAVAKAPDHWLDKHFPVSKKHWREQPCYLLLVDVRDRANAQRTYVVEENLTVVVDTRVHHPEIDDYFEDFDSIRYLPKARLKKLYPHD